jgi:predicted dehydrogenase
MVNIAVVGCGHWGPNHVRNFSSFPNSRIVACCDKDRKRLGYIKNLYPYIKTEIDYRAVLDNKNIDAIVIATPTATHYRLAKESLLAGKDVLCEKPLALISREAQELISIAKSKKLILMVGHVFLFNSGIQKIREYIEDKLLGKIYYLRSTRTNLGPIRNDVNVVLDLAVHDVSIFSYLLGKQPLMVNATGSKILRKNLEDIAFISLYYPDNILASIHVSWLDPRKVREITVVGNKKMAIWDDLSTTDTVRLYDKGVIREPYYDDFGQFQLLLREGDVNIPKLNLIEPLKTESLHFLQSIEKRRDTICSGKNVLYTIKVMEAIQKSLRKKGEAVKV